MNKAPFQKEEAAQGPGREVFSRPGPCTFAAGPPKKPLRPHRNGAQAAPTGGDAAQKPLRGFCQCAGVRQEVLYSFPVSL